MLALRAVGCSLPQSGLACSLDPRRGFDANAPFHAGHHGIYPQLYDEGERRLLYVAATRARDELRISGWGTASPLL
ncbi:MAG: hypothetical protein AB1Z98_33245 [Nannocystaceae bacterium]